MTSAPDFDDAVAAAERLLTAAGFAETRPSETRSSEGSGIVQVLPDSSAALSIATAEGVSRLGEVSVDERYAVEEGPDGSVIIRAHSPEAAFRARLRYALNPDSALAQGADGPRYAWRGLSVDVVRWQMPIAVIRSLIDLCALHGLNVLHLHLTDHQGWRAPLPQGLVENNPAALSEREYTELCAYAEQRFITLVPEIDMPGHTAALVALKPSLYGDRELPPHPFFTYLDPGNPTVRETVAQIVEHIAQLTPGPYIHIGGDEAFGMPAAAFAAFMEDAAETVTALGKLPLAWQETGRSQARVFAAQAWTAQRDLPRPGSITSQLPPEYASLGALVEAAFAEAPEDAPKLAQADIPVVISQQDPLYLDRKYSDASTDSEQNARMETLGFPAYEPSETRSVWDFDPLSSEAADAGARVCGVEAAIWCESVSSVADLSLLLLPRLALFAERSWQRQLSAPLPDQKWIALARNGWRALGFPADYRGLSLTEAEGL